MATCTATQFTVSAEPDRHGQLSSAGTTHVSDFASEPQRGEASQSFELSREFKGLAPRDNPVHGMCRKAVEEVQGPKRLRHLLKQGANVDMLDREGLAPLYRAAARGDPDNVQLLLDAGADVNPDHHLLGTPICIAALKGIPRMSARELFVAVLEQHVSKCK